MPANSRKDSLQVGALLVLIGAIGMWRHHGWGVRVIAIGALLAVVGLLAPGLLAPLWRAWHWLGRALNRVVSPVVLAVLYIGVVTPVGLLRRTLGRSPLSRDPDAASYWVERDPPADDSGEARRRHMRHPY